MRVLLYTAPPVALVLLQPDLGTAMTLAGITIGMMFFAGARLNHLATLVGAGSAAVVGAVVASLNGWVTILKPYQINRLIVFLDPLPISARRGVERHPVDDRHRFGELFRQRLVRRIPNAAQFFAGPAHRLHLFRHRRRVRLRGRPHRAVAVRRRALARRPHFLAAKDRAGSLLVAGVLSLLFLHVLINVGMTLGVMPVTGLPLPLISYGGTSVMVTLINIGLVLNVGLRRQKIQF